MKLNFSMLMFFLITTIPFFLLKSENTKIGKLEYVDFDLLQKDTIKIYKIINGEEDVSITEGHLDSRNKAFFFTI